MIFPFMKKEPTKEMLKRLPAEPHLTDMDRYWIEAAHRQFENENDRHRAYAMVVVLSWFDQRGYKIPVGEWGSRTMDEALNDLVSQAQRRAIEHVASVELKNGPL